MSEENKMKQIVTEMMEHICDNLCIHPKRMALSKEELDDICTDCKAGRGVINILNEYDRFNDFEKTQCAALMKKYSGCVKCSECEYQAYEKSTDIHWCRSAGGLSGELECWDGCTRGKRKEKAGNMFEWKFEAIIYRKFDGAALYTKMCASYEEAVSAIENNIEQFADIEYPPTGHINKDYVQVD